MLYKILNIKDIHVEDRARQDVGDLTELTDSIREKGVLEPIIVDRKLRLLAGERRLKASELAGMSTIPVLVRENDTELDALEVELLENVMRSDFTWQERARLEKRIYDKRVAMDPKWSQRRQAKMTNSSHGAGNIRLQLAEALEMLPELARHDNMVDAWKEYKKLEESVIVSDMVLKTPTEIKMASQWAADHYRVGDAFELMQLANNDMAHFAEVDPPYGVDLLRRKGRNQDTAGLDRYNEIPDEQYLMFMERTAAEVFRILKKDSFAVFWYGMTWHGGVLATLRKVGFNVPDIPSIWTKGPVGQTASPDTTFGSCFEPFFLARKGQPKLAVPGRSNVFEGFRPVSPQKKIHPTEKPIELLDEIIQTICFPGSVIFCPFLGSGVTLRSAYRNSHTGWGYDLDERNRELFLQRVYEDFEAGASEADGGHAVAG